MNYNNNIEIEVIKDYGQVVFDDSKSKKDFQKVANSITHYHHNTAGLTVAMFNVSVEAEGLQLSDSNSEYACVHLEKLKLYLTYDNVYVLIDKMYPKASCQYKVILEHEKKHVAIHKKALDFYAPRIAKALEQAAKNMVPRVMKKSDNVKEVLSTLSDKLVGQISGTLDEFETARDKANDNLDTKESYEEEYKKCDSW